MDHLVLPTTRQLEKKGEKREKNVSLGWEEVRGTPDREVEGLSGKQGHHSPWYFAEKEGFSREQRSTKKQLGTRDGRAF